MNESQSGPEAGELPKAKVKKTRWSYSIVWAVPLTAVICLCLSAV